jgi:hypothetical protein
MTGPLRDDKENIIPDLNFNIAERKNRSPIARCSPQLIYLQQPLDVTGHDQAEIFYLEL